MRPLTPLDELRRIDDDCRCHGDDMKDAVGSDDCTTDEEDPLAEDLDVGLTVDEDELLGDLL